MGLFTPSADTTDRDRWEKLHPLVSNGVRNFKILGAALKEIRDQQLYRFAYETFEQCCTTHWKISARHATRLIVAFEASEEIGPTGQTELSESQLRPLTTLPAGQRRAAYEEASADGGDTAAIERAVEKRKPRKKKSAVAKPLRFRLPGATVTITPNKKYHGLTATVAHLVQVTTEQQRDAA